MRALLALVLGVAAFEGYANAQRCDTGLTLQSGQCCIAPGSVPGASCQVSASFNPKTTCTWLRQSDDVRFTYKVPAAITSALGMTLKGTHGEWLNAHAPDALRQRGSIMGTGAFSGESHGKTLTIYPGSNYGRPGGGGGLPASGYPGTRGVDWTRGGAASSVSDGSWTIYAAGGGGQGPSYGPGTDADFWDGNYYFTGSPEGQAPLLGTGGGGAGLRGGQSNPSTGSCGTFGQSTCCYPTYGAARGGQSGVSGSFSGSAFLNQQTRNSDLSPNNPMVIIDFACGAPVPTTTSYLPTPASTLTVTEQETILETSTVPSPTTTITTTVESAQPLEYFDSTVIPDSVTTTRTDTTTTYPPESTDVVNVTPDTSTLTESPTVTTTPVVSTVYETFTPATIFVTETVEETVTPATAYETVTSTPEARIVPTTITEQKTVSSGTTTAVVSSATGNANCFHFRMVYPPACCPTTYIKGLKPWTGPGSLRRRHVVFARDLTTVYTPSGTTTVTVSTATTQTDLATPDAVIITETETTPGPVTTSTRLSTAEAGTVVVDETSTVAGEASTTTLTVTAPAPSVTVTETQYVEAETPLFTDVSTAEAPRSTAIETSFSTLPTPVSTVQVEAETPITTSTLFETQFRTVPATTTTSTAYSRATTCAVRPPMNIKCPAPILRGADQIVQTALIKGQRFLSGNRAVQIDCGSAGVYSYV